MTTQLQPVLKPDKVPPANEGRVNPLSADERLLRKAVQRVLRAQVAEVHGKVEGSKASAVPSNLTKWDKAVVQEIRPVWFGLFKKGGDRALKEIRRFPKHARKMAVLGWAEMEASVRVDVVCKGGPGSGSWEGPGDPRFAREDGTGTDVNKLPIRTYVRTTQGEGYIITHTPTGALINMSKRAKADADDNREVNSSDLIAVFNDETQKWDRLDQHKSLKASPSIVIPDWIEDPDVLQALEREMFKFAQGIDQTTADALREELMAGMEDGETISQLANRISDISDEWVEGWRSEMIARTETARAFTTGHIEAWRSTGVVSRKVWVAAGDACPFCQEMDGTVVDLDENFFDQGETQTADWKDQEIEMSHDYSNVNGPPLHPACRCVLIAMLDESTNTEEQ